MGDGFETKFWHDAWCEVVSPKDGFADLFVLATHKNAKTAELRERVIGIQDFGRVSLI